MIVSIMVDTDIGLDRTATPKPLAHTYPVNQHVLPQSVRCLSRPCTFRCQAYAHVWCVWSVKMRHEDPDPCYFPLAHPAGHGTTSGLSAMPCARAHTGPIAQCAVTVTLRNPGVHTSQQQAVHAAMSSRHGGMSADDADGHDRLIPEMV
jgi:hypothetical protein